jgi:hypothetical protein
MLPFFVGSYFAYKVVVRVRSALQHENGITISI